MRAVPKPGSESFDVDRHDSARDAILIEIPASQCRAAAATTDPLLTVAPLDLGELEGYVLGKERAGFDTRRDLPNEHVFKLDLEILDWLAVPVGAHELKLCLRNGFSRRAGLHQNR